MEQKESEITSQPNTARDTVPGLTACGPDARGAPGGAVQQACCLHGEADLPEPIALPESFPAPSATRLIFCAVSFSLSGRELGENSAVGNVWVKFSVLCALRCLTL